MGRKWKSVKDMVKDLSDSDFYNKYINRDMHPIALQMLDSRYLRNYQDRRFYLSDYPEQEKLREEYFALKRASYNFTVNNNETYWFESKFLTRR